MKDNKLFCFHHAGGSSLIFSKWKNMPPALKVIPVEMPGHGIRMGEKCIVDFDRLVDMLTEEVNKQCGESNIYIYGHSLGAALAFEVAKNLESNYGRRVTKLFVAGRHPPYMKEPSKYRTTDGMDALKEELLKLGMVTEDNINDKIFQESFLPMIYADYRLHENYRYKGGMIDIPVVAFSGSDDESAPNDIVSGWGKVTSSTFRQYQLYGGHFFPYNEKEKDFLRILLNEINVSGK